MLGLQCQTVTPHRLVQIRVLFSRRETRAFASGDMEKKMEREHLFRCRRVYRASSAFYRFVRIQIAHGVRPVNRNDVNAECILLPLAVSYFAYVICVSARASNAARTARRRMRGIYFIDYASTRIVTALSLRL